MALLADVRALTDGLLQSHEERFKEIAEIRQATDHKLAVLSRERAQAQAERGARRESDAADRRTRVASLLEGYSQDLASTASLQRAQLQDNATRNRAAVAGLLNGYKRDLSSTASRQRAQLKSDIARNRTAVTSLLDAFDRERASNSSRQQAQLQAVTARNRATVAGLLAGFDRDRASTASYQRVQLKSSAARNTAEVNELLDGFHVERVALTRERADWARVWRGYVVKRSEIGGTQAISGASTAQTKQLGGQLPTALEDSVFGFLASHPDGVERDALEREFHASRSSVGRALEGLIAENRARKDASRGVYLAT